MDPVKKPGIKTSEFWFMVIYVAVVAGSGYMRITHGQGLSEVELGMITAAVGGHWYGRSSLKKEVAKANQPVELKEKVA